MKIDLTLSDGIALQFTSGIGYNNGYPTARIQKGWLLLCDGSDLSEEAVGFGVPILKQGLKTIFPGEVTLSADKAGPQPRFYAHYHVNLEEKISKDGESTIDSQFVYNTKNFLAGMIRGLPALRRALTSASSWTRDQFGWQTTYEQSVFSAEILLTYTIFTAENKLQVELAEPCIASQNISEIIIMNEQGANHFDEYHDGDGIKRGDQIGCWDEVTGPEAAFISQSSRLSFSLPRVEGARLYHGRELVDSRLAWSGFGYSFPPSQRGFRYEVTLQRLR